MNARPVVVATAVIIGLINCSEASGAAVVEDAACTDGCPELQMAPTYLRDWVVSTSGSDSGLGTAASPFRTINRAVAAASAGERILVNAGTYAERVRITGSIRAGTSAQPIRLQGLAGARIVPPTTSSGTLMVIEKPYWQVDGFEIDVQGKAFFAVSFSGTVTGSVISHCNIHGGSSGAGVSTHYAAVGATIEDNEIHHFVKPNADSHGVVVQPGSRSITIRRNVIHDNSGDSVQCLGPEGYSSEPPADGVVISENEMYRDRENAVDIKTCHNVTIYKNRMHDYLQSLPGANAVVVHMSAHEVTIKENDIWNVGKGIAIGGNRTGPVPYHVVVVKNRIWNVSRGYQMDGVGVRLENSRMARVFHNTFSGIAYAAIMAGGGTGGNTDDLMIKDNLIVTGNTTAYAIYLGPSLSALLTRSNLFAPGVLFSAINGSGARQTYSFSGWQGTGRDTTSRQLDPQLDPTTLKPGPLAVDWGEYVGQPYCGPGPDLGAVETACL